MVDPQTKTYRLDLAHPQGRSTIGNIWHNFKRYKWAFFIGAIFLVLTNYFAFEIPRFIGEAVDLMKHRTAGESIATDAIIDYAIYIIVFALLAGVTRLYSRVFIFNAARDIEFDIRNALYQKLSLLNPTYFDSIRTGDLTSRVTNDVTHVRVLYAIAFLHLVNALIAYAVALQKMFAMNIVLTIICLAPFPLLLVLIKKLVQELFRYSTKSQSKLSEMSSSVQENLAGMAIVKTYRLEDTEIDSFKNQNAEFIGINLKRSVVDVGLNATTYLVAGLGSLLSLIAGGYMLQNGSLTLPQFVTFNGYVTALAFPTTAMGWVFSCWNRGLASYKRVLTVLDAPVLIASPQVPAELPPRGEAAGAISLKKVTFSYGAEDVLHDITIDIEAGSSIAIVGKTGSGKTTLAKLLVRLYDPKQGQITFDGIDLRNLDIRKARSEIGVVSQEPFLFSMSLHDNIRFGLDALEFDTTVDRSLPTESLLHPGSTADTETRIAEAIEIAGLSTDIDAFPEGLQTIVGERGITLSGGQKQRTTIARALLMDPRLLILDDALSAVDTKTEAKILDHLQTVMKHRTSILITHRFNALDRVDKIIVLDHGRIVDIGTHKELIAKEGIYKELWHKQQLSEELAEEEVKDVH